MVSVEKGRRVEMLLAEILRLVAERRLHRPIAQHELVSYRVVAGERNELFVQLSLLLLFGVGCRKHGGRLVLALEQMRESRS